MRHSLLLAIMLLGAAGPVSAELPDGIKFDDGFTWFECRNFEAYENNKPVGRWVLVSNLRVLGKIPDRSGWKIVVKKDGKALAEYASDGYPVKLLARGPSVGMNIVGFWRDKPRIEADGLLDVAVYYIDGKTDKEHLAKTCKLDVRKTAKERGSVGQRDPGPPSFFVNRHAETLSSILYFRPPEHPSYTQAGGVGTHTDSTVELILNYCENADFAAPRVGRIRVEVDGKEIELKVPNNAMLKDEMGSGQDAGKYNVEHSDRGADKYFKSGPAYRERIGFARRSILLPLHWGARPKGRPATWAYATDHPGEWKVTYLIDRKPVRVFRFTLGKDGLPLPHPEQAKGLTLLPGAVLVDTEIPGEGGEFDGRLTNEFVKAGAFFGRPWQTDATKKRAEQVPTKGAPFPVPSDQQK